jgi:hypothetical protein
MESPKQEEGKQCLHLNLYVNGKHCGEREVKLTECLGLYSMGLYLFAAREHAEGREQE